MVASILGFSFPFADLILLQFASSRTSIAPLYNWKGFTTAVGRVSVRIRDQKASLMEEPGVSKLLL